jgi:hypothetical protein
MGVSTLIGATPTNFCDYLFLNFFFKLYYYVKVFIKILSNYFIFKYFQIIKQVFFILKHWLQCLKYVFALIFFIRLISN